MVLTFIVWSIRTILNLLPWIICCKDNFNVLTSNILYVTIWPISCLWRADWILAQITLVICWSYAIHEGTYLNSGPSQQPIGSNGRWYWKRLLAGVLKRTAHWRTKASAIVRIVYALKRKLVGYKKDCLATATSIRTKNINPFLLPTYVIGTIVSTPQFYHTAKTWFLDKPDMALTSTNTKAFWWIGNIQGSVISWKHELLLAIWGALWRLRA